MYPNIDMVRTGQKLKELISAAGYDVKAIQSYLHLSCPQPIYRWFKGKTLPTVEHLYALSRLLEVHMEELLVSKSYPVYVLDYDKYNSKIVQLDCYYERLCNYA